MHNNFSTKGLSIISGDVPGWNEKKKNCKQQGGTLLSATNYFSEEGSGPK